MNKKLLNPLPTDTSLLAPYTANITNCWRCSHCKWVPSPISHKYSVACPSVEWGGFHSYSGGGKVITAYALKEGEAAYSEKAIETIFACTACGACDVSCKTNNGDNIDPLDVIYALRATVAEEGKSPDAHKLMIENLNVHGSDDGLHQADRLRWTEGLGIQNALDRQVEVLLHIGYENVVNESSRAEIKTIVRLLSMAGINFGTLIGQEISTGEVAYDLGYPEDARAAAQRMSQIFNAAKANCIVTCSASSYSGVRNIWPRLDVSAPQKDFLHITDFLYSLVEGGQLSLSPNLNAKVTYHDPCKLGRLSEVSAASPPSKWVKVRNTIAIRETPKKTLFGTEGLYESPRRLLQAVKGLDLVEMERNRLASYCCGAGGGAKEAYPEFARFAGNNRLNEAEATGASIIVTSCAKCRQHLAEVAGAEGIKVMGLFELIGTAIDKEGPDAR
ncbi:MAG: (Fe-S)-binding protein [Candidatus Thiodiazotropha sp.]